jgi:cell division protease FtsH
MPWGWIPLVVLLFAFSAWQYVQSQEPTRTPISYFAFYQLVEAGQVERIVLRGQEATGKLKATQMVEGTGVEHFTTMLPAQEDPTLLPLLREKAVRLDVKSEEQSFWAQAAVFVVPWLLILGVWIWLSRRTQRMLGQGFPFGAPQSRSHRFEREAQVKVTFDDVAGLTSAKRDLGEIVEFLKHPERFRRLGGKVPRGVLLVGPPGTGKTLLARAVAGESGVPFFSITGSEFIELFVGVGASRVRELFAEAKKVAPAIIFIDEIDAVGRSRGAGLGGGHDEREQTLNQLLAEMDGFTRNDLTVVLAATNRPDVLDSALLRPGRFDRRVLLDRPEAPARRAILGVHTKDKPLAPDVDLDRLAKNTPGFSGADLANLVNEAALSATRRGAETIEARDLTAAYDKVVLGDPRETKLDAEEKRRVAVHEAGHAIAAHFSSHAEPLQRVSILPRGMALGATQQSPSADRHITTRAELESQLAVLMGGYAAENVVFGDTSSGASSDLQKATSLAFEMVAHFGMSERLGPIYVEHKTEHPFLGHVLATEGGSSDATIHMIEQEVRRILGQALDSARSIIHSHRAELERLVNQLLEQETLDHAALEAVLGNGSADPVSLH